MYTSEIFKSIRESLSKASGDGGNSVYKNILKPKAGKTYVLRLVPNIKDGSSTFFHYYSHGWDSFSTGDYVSIISLQTFGKRDPIGTERLKIKKSDNQLLKEKAEKVKWNEYWAVNVYVVDDPENPENNGTVKILRYGRQLNKIIEAAVDGEDSDEFGQRVFDLGEGGVNFKLKAEKQGPYTVYTSSRFSPPSDLGLSKEKVEQIQNSVFDLTTIIQTKTEEEIKEFWNTHFLCVNSQTEKQESSKQSSQAKREIEEDEVLESISKKDDLDVVSDVEIDDFGIDELIEDVIKSK
jgi:hypothetical protein